MERMKAEMQKIRADEAKLQEDMAKWRAEIEEVREIAESYYDAASPEVRAQAKHFFNSMDRDGNGRVDLEEFLSFMRREGHTHMRNNSFFRMLDTTGRGALAFMDVITLYYIIKSGRPFCAFCREFIPATFFSCVTCFNCPNNSFIICRRCHKSKNHEHKHGGRCALFLDNYTLLQATKLHSPTTTNQQPIRATLTEPTRGHSLRRSASVHPQRPLLLGQGDSASTSTSTDKTAYVMKELDRVLAQSHSRLPDRSLSTVTAAKSVAKSSTPNTHRQTAAKSVAKSSTPDTHRQTAAKSLATSSTPNTHRQTSRDTHQKAIVPATQPVSWKDIASASFKALDKMIMVGNFVNVVAAVSFCTIM